MNEQYYVGTDLKFKIAVESGGIDVNNFDIVLRCGNVTYQCKNTDFAQDETGTYLLIDTTKFGNGALQMIVYAKVDDNHFDNFEGRGEDGYRTEVAMVNLCKLKNL